METIFTSIVCSIIAALVVHILAMQRMKKNEIEKFKLKAYSDFLGASSRLAVRRRTGDIEHDIEEMSKLNDAKNRILICSNHALIAELIEFWKKGATLEKEGELQTYKRLVQLMREDLGYKENDLLRLDVSGALALGLSDFLFKLEPATCSYKAGKLE